MSADNSESTLKPAALRGILEYVPQFRDHIFVIAIDGSVIDHENFGNVLTDIAVLKSLNIRLVIVHGIGRQINELAKAESVKITDAYGEGPTDEATLALALKATGVTSQQIIAGLTQNNLKCSITNALRGVPIGILKGKNQKLTAKIEKIDLPFINKLIDDDVIPIVSPIIYSREGTALRANSDLLASELAVQLEASKLIYLTTQPGLTINNEVVMNIPLEELDSAVRKNIQSIDERIRSKALHAAKTLEKGTPRAHILDGRVFGGLLTEIFDKVGLGTMIHANEYQQIRKARKKDIQGIFNIIKNASKAEALRYRSRQSIEKDIENFYVYEVDASLIACLSLVPMGKSKTIEMGSVLVQSFYQGKGVGKNLVEFACMQAASLGYNKIVALSTQTSAFFKSVAGFTEGSVKDLSAKRKQELKTNGRKSTILVKQLKKTAQRN